MRTGSCVCYALRVDDLVRLALERLSDTPTPAQPAPPSPTVSSGPQGAFRVTIGRGGPAEAWVPGARRRRSDRGLHARPHRWELPTPSTLSGREHVGDVRDVRDHRRPDHAHGVGRRWLRREPILGRVAVARRCPHALRRELRDPTRLRSAVRAPLGPGRLRFASLDDRRGRDGGLTGEPASVSVPPKSATVPG